MSFTDKVVIVTGASSGIGAATAEVFAAEGARVVMVARNQHKLSDVAARCQRAAAGRPPLVLQADVADEQDAKSIIQKTIDTYGKIDVLVNNAGIARFGTILEGNLLETYEEIMKTNVRAVVLLTELAAPHLIKSKGNIVNISSMISTKPMANLSMYGLSKAALDHFTRSAALELAAAGVRVNAINPGPVLTDILENAGSSMKFEESMLPLGRVSEPRDIAGLVVFLAGESARAVTGSCYLSDDGMMLK